MMSIELQPVVMAGGSGTRLWPLSRAQFPKQFLVLQGDRSLFILPGTLVVLKTTEHGPWREVEEHVGMSRQPCIVFLVNAVVV